LRAKAALSERQIAELQSTIASQKRENQELRARSEELAQKESALAAVKADLQKVLRRSGKDRRLITNLRREVQQLTAQCRAFQEQLATAIDSEETLLAANQVLRDEFALVRSVLSHAVQGKGEERRSLKELAVAVEQKVESLEREIEKAAGFDSLEKQLETERAVGESRAQAIFSLTADLTASTEGAHHLKQLLVKLQEQVDAAHQQTAEAIAGFSRAELALANNGETEVPNVCPPAKRLLEEIVSLLENEGDAAAYETSVEDWNATYTGESSEGVPEGLLRKATHSEAEEEVLFDESDTNVLLQKLGHGSGNDVKQCSDSDEDND
jgi:chromosome segregation ATPase